MKQYGIRAKALLVLAIGVAAAACNGVTMPPADQFSKTFPNEPGSEWVYSAYNTHTQLFDTITVSIVGAVTLPDHEPASIWQYTSRYESDTQYVARSGDTVNYYILNESGYHLASRFIFPLTMNSRWSDAFTYDTSVVHGNEAVTVPAGNFPDGIRVDRSYPRYNMYPWIITWFVPDTGIVKWEEIKYEFGPLTESARVEYTLIRYRIAAQPKR